MNYRLHRSKDSYVRELFYFAGYLQIGIESGVEASALQDVSSNTKETSQACSGKGEEVVGAR